MIHIYTSFDDASGRPLFAVIHKPGGSSELLLMHMPGYGTKFSDIWNAEKKLINIVNNDEIIINNYKQHLLYFGTSIHRTSGIYDNPIDIPSKFNKDIEAIHKVMDGIICKLQPQIWQQLRANAAYVYQMLENRGLLCGITPIRPRYTMDQFSGRTSVHIDAEYRPYLCNPNNSDIFIQFDWMAADLRIAAILSNDECLEHSFAVSDPYTYFANEINGDNEEITRDDAKSIMFRSLYTLDDKSPAMEFYNKLGRWICTTRYDIAKNKYSESILGRKFRISKERDIKSVFNAIMQGSVVHAMNNCIAKVFDLYGDDVFYEEHDSLTITCPSKDTSEINDRIKKISRIMIRPFDGIIDIHHDFPLTVRVGAKFKKGDGRLYKSYRTLGEI